MIAILTALLLTIATQAEAECDKQCDRDWWGTATAADIRAKLDAGAELTAREIRAFAPLMRPLERQCRVHTGAHRRWCRPKGER